LSTAALELALAQLGTPQGVDAVSDVVEVEASTKKPGTPSAPVAPEPIRKVNRDLDTGALIVPGGYPLTDRTYAKLLAKVTQDPTKPMPAGLKGYILRYYADPDAPISTKRNRKKWAEVQNQLRLLPAIPTSGEAE